MIGLIIKMVQKPWYETYGMILHNIAYTDHLVTFFTQKKQSMHEYKMYNGGQTVAFFYMDLDPII